MIDNRVPTNKTLLQMIVGTWSFGILRCALCVVVVHFLPVIARAEITIGSAHRGAGIAVYIDGNLFTQYLAKAGHSPAIWPIVGPTSMPMTRGFPFTPAMPDGTHDHPHHQSLWFTHDNVNNVNFWGTNVNDEKGDHGPHVAERPSKDLDVEWQGPDAKFVTRNDWVDGNKRVCEDQRTIVFGQDRGKGRNDDRWIDFTITIKASNGDVTFGDTKEGSFALRVADSMRVDAKQGGHIVNSDGLENVAAWGMPARWVDYTGPIDGETVGIAIMSHPKSFRPVPRWHVRTYGLFAANPFGEKDFPKSDKTKQGAVTIKNGDSLTLRYLVLLHRGKTNVEKIEAAFRDFAGK